MSLPKIKNTKGTIVPIVPIDSSKVESRFFTIDEFFAIRKNPKQRHTPTQAKKNKKLRKFLPMHATDQINIGKLTRDMQVYDSELAQYVTLKAGTFVLLNGHTRQYVWRNGMSDKIPEEIYANVYLIGSPEENDLLYDSYDSSHALEKNNQKIYGELQQLGFTPSSKRMTSGNILTGMNFAYHVHNNDHKNVTVNHEFFAEQCAFFIEELKGLDELFLNKNLSNWNQPKVATYLCGAKRYGVSDPLFLKFFTYITSRLGGTNTQIDSGKYDGATHVNTKKWQGNKTIWGNGSDEGLHETVSYNLYWLEKFMENKPLARPHSSWRDTTKDWGDRCVNRQTVVNFFAHTNAECDG